MGKFKGILIVSDIDGTFLSMDAENLKKNIEAVKKFKEQGGLFTFATGRDLNALLAVVPDALSIANAPVIALNGTQIYDAERDKYIHDCPIADKQLLAECLGLIRGKYPEVGVRFSSGNNMIVPDFNEMLKRNLRNVSLEKMRCIEMPLDEVINSGVKIYKCVVVDLDTPDNLEDIRKIFEGAVDKNGNNSGLCAPKSSRFQIEVMNGASSKGRAVKYLKEYTGASKVYAVGDYENDMDMLKAADCGAAPADAIDEIKRAAQIITAGCDEGAVADLIDIIGKRQ